MKLLFTVLQDLHHLGDLVFLIQERLKLAYEVAVYKLRHNQTILDTSREAQVLANVVYKARNEPLEPVWVRQFFVDQMEANKAVQQLFVELVVDEKINLQDWPEIDLVRDIRPKIDQLNTLLIKMATKTRCFRSKQKCSQSIKQFTQGNFSISVHRMAQILHEVALAHVCV